MFRAAFSVLALLACPLTAAAQESEPAPAGESATNGIVLTLDRAVTQENACQLTFMIRNPTEVDLERVSYEMAFLNADGRFERLVLLQFEALSPGQQKVAQYSIRDLPCEGISQVFPNEVSTCDAAGGGATDEVCRIGQMTMATGSDVPVQFGF